MSKKFRVWRPENGQDRDDGRDFIAYDAEEAAEKWARRYDNESAEYAIVGGQHAEVMVADGNTVYTFIVTGETVAQYSARLKVQEKAR